MKVFSGFLNQNIYGDLGTEGKERRKFFVREGRSIEGVEERCSSNTPSSLMVFTVQPV
jgi:hypothetical protein